jgi:tetratricopeptide (TPR) repeat protein
MGKYDRAIQYYEKALAGDLKTFGSDHPDVASDWNNLGMAWQALGKYDKAIQYYEKALKIFEEFLGKDHPKTKIVRENLAAAKQKKK